VQLRPRNKQRQRLKRLRNKQRSAVDLRLRQRNKQQRS
jgi:hypothetical protein